MTDLKKLRTLAEHHKSIGSSDMIAKTEAIIEIIDRLERYEKALEHYESAHYTISGFPCDHDVVAREALEGGK